MFGIELIVKRKAHSFGQFGTKLFVVNSWHVHFLKDVDDTYHMCNANIPETIMHRFWDCRLAHTAWDFSIGTMNFMKAKGRQSGPWKPPDWQHGIFGMKFPTSLSKISRIERNDLTFNNNRWQVTKTIQMIRHNLLDNARIAWDTTHKDADRTAIYDERKELLYHRDNTRTIHWHIRTPIVGFVNYVSSSYRAWDALISLDASKKARHSLWTWPWWWCEDILTLK